MRFEDARAQMNRQRCADEMNKMCWAVMATGGSRGAIGELFSVAMEV
jgi:hypothetical protein